RGERPGLNDARGGEGRSAVLRSPRGSGGPPDGPADRGEDPGERRLAEEERQGPRSLVCIVEALTPRGKVFLGRGRWEDAHARGPSEPQRSEEHTSELQSRFD